jgi:hypothetical protein
MVTRRMGHGQSSSNGGRYLAAVRREPTVIPGYAMGTGVNQ